LSPGLILSLGPSPGLGLSPDLIPSIGPALTPGPGPGLSPSLSPGLSLSRNPGLSPDSGLSPGSGLSPYLSSNQGLGRFGFFGFQLTARPNTLVPGGRSTVSRISHSSEKRMCPTTISEGNMSHSEHWNT
jgi:hypothetical protein